MKKISLGLIGVGSCASSLVQMIHMNKNASHDGIFGVQEEFIGEYKVGDIEIVSAIDIDSRKVGLKISDSISSNIDAATLFQKLPEIEVPVVAGVVLDGAMGKIANVIPIIKSESTADKIIEYWKKTRTEMVICFLPTGSTMAVQFYASCAAKAGVAFINATPEPVSNNPELAELFERGGIPLLGDDIRSHLGATTLHMALIELLKSRGIQVDGMYQINIGGNTDFLNLSDSTRSKSKEKSKIKALSSLDVDLGETYAGPAAFVPYLKDTKVCYLRIEGKSVLKSPISIELRLQVEDSPNAAGTMLNAIRVCKIAIDRGLRGNVHEVCAYLFKSPVRLMKESESLAAFREFI